MPVRLWITWKPGFYAGHMQTSSRGTLTTWADLKDDGSLVLSGQDLGGHPMGGEYEYAHTVPPGQVPLVVAALGGAPGDPVLPLLERHAELVVGTGEGAWLASIGVEPGFWSRLGD
jgi:hypothetical protein